MLLRCFRAAARYRRVFGLHEGCCVNQGLYGGATPEHVRAVEGFEVVRYCYRTGMVPDQGVI